MDITNRKIFNFLLVALGLAILWYSWVVWVYVASALVLTLVLSPLNQALRKLRLNGYGMTNGLAATTTMLILVGLVVLIMNIFVPVITREVKLLSTVKMDEFYEILEPELRSFSLLYPDEVMDKAGTQSEKEIIKKLILGKKNLERVPHFFTGLASGVSGSIIAFFSVLFITFFLLKDDELFNGFIYSLSSDENETKVKQVLDKVKKTLSRYFLGIVIQVSIITFFVSVGLSLFGFENALVIGLFAGFMNVIPYVGPLIGLAFGLLIGISTNIELAAIQSFWRTFGEIVLIFGITQFFDNFVTQPVVFSKSINAHPLEIFLVILIAGNISGISGMIIAVPLYSVIRIIAKEYYGDSKFIQYMTQAVR